NISLPYIGAGTRSFPVTGNFFSESCSRARPRKRHRPAGYVECRSPASIVGRPLELHPRRARNAVTGFRRLGIVIAAVVAAMLGGLAAAPLFIPADAVRGAVKAEIKAMTGLDPVV